MADIQYGGRKMQKVVWWERKLVLGDIWGRWLQICTENLDIKMADIIWRTKKYLHIVNLHIAFSVFFLIYKFFSMMIAFTISAFSWRKLCKYEKILWKRCANLQFASFFAVSDYRSNRNVALYRKTFDQAFFLSFQIV